MKVKKMSWIQGVMLGIGFAALPAWTMTQEEVDAIVDRRILLYEHADVAHDAVEHLETKGATRQMLAEAFAKVLLRDMNVGKGEEGYFRANAAIYWLGEMGNESQLTNLLFVAQNATNWHASSAIDVYYARCSDKSKFVEVADSLLDRSDVVGLHSSVWNFLEVEAKGVLKSRVIAIAEKHLQDSGFNTFYADEILAEHQPQYAKSLHRLAALRAALRKKGQGVLTPVMRKKIETVIQEFERK